MTKTVKKRLQAVVALLVTLMIMIGIMPSDVFDGILNGTTVNAAFSQNSGWTYITIYFDPTYTGNSSSDWSSLSSNPGNLKLMANDMVDAENTGFSDMSTDNEYKVESTDIAGNGTRSGNLLKITVVKYKSTSDPGNSSGNKVRNLLLGNSQTISNIQSSNNNIGYKINLASASDGYVYKLSGSGNSQPLNGSDTSYTRSDIARNGTINDYTPADQTQRAYLAGVNYFNYYYDEQVLNTSDPDTMTITQGQYKSPYAYFNQAIMANTDYMNGNNVPMYLGEYWIGSGAEGHGGNYNGQSYDSDTAAGVVAGIYNRPCGVTDLSTTGSVPNATLQNFKWGANLAYRGGGEPSYHTVAQGLIDSTLSLNPTDSNYLIPTKNGKNVPYFDKNWLNHTIVQNVNTTPTFTTVNTTSGDGNNHIGKVYTSTFPFYYSQEVNLTALNTSAITSGWQFGSSNLVGVNKTGGMTENANASDPQDDHTIDMYFDGTDGTPIVTSNESKVLIQHYLDNTTVSALRGKHVYDVDGGIATLDNSTEFTKVNEIASAITADHTSLFTEEEIHILNMIKYFYDPGHVKDVDGFNGFFPFNKSGDELKELEYGFGVRLDIKFNINKYGTEDGTNTNASVPEIFRFTGDDDVWVFIDGQLALDMGGGHKNAIGEINFQTKKTAIIYTGAADNNNTCNGWDSSGTSDGITKLNATTSPAVESVLQEILDEAAANTDKGNISNEHTLTFFYMERGKLNSNMSLMFNFYAPEIVKIPPGEGETFPSTNPDPASDRKFSIREVTNFDNINPGLVSATKLIAEDDVFTYDVQNNTVNADVNNPDKWGTERAYVPTRDVYTRTHAEAIANISPEPSVSTNLTNGSGWTWEASGNYIYLDVSQNSTWLFPIPPMQK